MRPASTLVIGAGLAGMAAAIHLRNSGYKVTVVEKNAAPGGRCDRVTQDGHIFDTGPTLFVMPLAYQAEFASMGVNLRDILDLQRVDPTYTLVFDDGSQLALTSDLEHLRLQLENIEPGSFGGFLRYLEEGHRHYHVAMQRLVNRDFRSAFQFFSLGNLPLVHSIKPLVPHYRHMSAFFKNPRLRAAFSFQDVYMGLSPFQAPSTFSMMPYTELAHGVWYPAGGMYRVAETLADLASQRGVEFIFNKTVERIDVRNRSARGLLIEGDRFLEADAVLANADLPYVYKDLLPDRARAEQLLQKRYSCSVVSFLWGLDKPYLDLPPHTLFLADNYRQNFDSIINDLDVPENPSLYVHAPARLDPSMAPAGQDTLIAIVPVGHLDEEGNQDWEERQDRARLAVFRRLSLLGITDLPAHIKFEISFTPLFWRNRYNLV
ncbi:MAG: hypothetical protein A2Z16_10790, partial [Chloroflexi bacterium RBG_16_54_18]